MDATVKEHEQEGTEKSSRQVKWTPFVSWGAGGLAILALIFYPVVNGQDSFGISLLTEIMIYGLFALSLNLLLGYTGLVSFGHATYFGLGAYVAGILGTNLQNNNFWLALLVSLGITGLVGLVLGFLAIRTSGIYFLMLTLAFSQLFYAIAFKWNDVTGGSNGLPVSQPDLSLPGWTPDWGNRATQYFVTLFFFLLGFFLLRQLIYSPFGQTLIGIRDNENRMSALGYQTRNFKLVACVIAGGLAGVAGTLNAFHNNFVSANEFYWTTSGLVMVMVLLGGKGSLVGPALGAFFIRYTEQFIQSQKDFKLGSFVMSERWYLVLGIIFIGFVLLAPNGIVGLWQNIVGWVRARIEKR